MIKRNQNIYRPIPTNTLPSSDLIGCPFDNSHIPLRIQFIELNQWGVTYVRIESLQCPR